MKPILGRVVHYRRNPGADPLAALVVHVWPGDGSRVNLAIFGPTAGVTCASGVPPIGEDDPREDRWEWPPREGGATIGPLVLELKLDAADCGCAWCDGLRGGGLTQPPAYCRAQDGANPRAGANPRDGSDGEE